MVIVLYGLITRIAQGQLYTSEYKAVQGLEQFITIQYNKEYRDVKSSTKWDTHIYMERTLFNEGGQGCDREDVTHNIFSN